MLDLETATITIDAMDCQKEVSTKIVEREGDYLLELKDDHPKLCQVAEKEYFKASEADVPLKILRHGVQFCLA